MYNEYVAYARLVSAIFTLNFSDGESVKIFFGGLTHDECYKVQFAVIETSHALQNLKTAGIDSLFNTCAEKLKISRPLFAGLFHAYILQFPGEPDYVDENEDDWLYTLLNPLVHDIESEFYKLATDEAPHPAETFLIPVVDQAKFFPSMVAMNLINAVLRYVIF